jgi:hypothetical protein
MKIKARCLTVVAALAALTAAHLATAQSSWFVASLAGGHQTDNLGDVDGHGVAAVGIDGSTNHYYIWVTDIAMPTAAHIHTGAGPIVVTRT